MANINKWLKNNVEGDFFVDSTCINSSACRNIAPEIFAEHAGRSYVKRQPDSEKGLARGLMAISACPSRSIGRTNGGNEGVTSDAFPEKIDGEVYYCGFNSPLSFGASSYFVARKAGNLLVDSPSFDPLLVKKLEGMGGVAFMFLTHRDDVGEHEKFASHFKCRRIIHSADWRRGLGEIEIMIDGTDPIDLENDIKIIPVPGHTKGSACLLYKNYLFTGDHLAKNENRSHPTAFNNHCWYSWSEQTESMKRLAEYDFEWILPGHSGRAHYPLDEMKKKMAECVAWMVSVK
jgi:glyoxylase-like metal-dependent hydrolase (beta-lactamase superfamily II)/ferredoxin